MIDNWARLSWALVAAFSVAACGGGGDDGLTGFGVPKVALVDELSEPEKKDYCNWMLDLIEGDASTITCGETEVPAVSVEDCVGSAFFIQPCEAGAIERCALAGGFDMCNPTPFEGEACEDVRTCLAQSAPTNGCPQGELWSCRCTDATPVCAESPTAANDMCQIQGADPCHP